MMGVYFWEEWVAYFRMLFISKREVDRLTKKKIPILK